MGTILDYMDWRGDLSFRQSEFNEVDNLILAMLSYVELDGIVPGVGKNAFVTVEQAAQRYFEEHTAEEIRAEISFTHLSPFVLRKMGECRRFKNAKLSKYVNQIDERLQKQFSALHIELDDKSIYVAFRGTDDTIIGWQEDFNMSFMTVPSQTAAVDYLKATLRTFGKKYRVGGHSKGGNLAVYAAVMSSKHVRSKIREIYNNDGPGFTKAFVAMPEYEEILPRIYSFVPESSVIGMLLEHREERKIVASAETGIMQHDGLTWQVLGNHFEYKTERTRESVLLDETLKSWLSGLDASQRESCINSLFSVLSANGDETLTDIANGGIKSLGAIMKSITTMDEKTKSIISELIRMLRKEYGKEVVTPIIEKLVPKRGGVSRKSRWGENKNGPDNGEKS
ncbi:DUF2974 domain-containing protein [Hespellia stercorisuis]|uniref:DUF2974 domain-containing protein n=1 Tax=Hespellia stercorisuis DSM 15480 TaxID=1121950 RepID=A0A1M6JGF5_9FIRM|nr:DUF2974 domain-containing protein [Hespellia stercorisuis]SHJ45662.1 Protein of unknown function [Hespellia stercorisuis DSM 15480]